MESKITKTFEVKIYLAGDIEIAKQICREETFREGLCITISPCNYIYTGGEESGYVVGLLNYPRFPSTPEQILERADRLAVLLMEKGCQWSAMIISPQETKWFTRREKGVG